MSIGLGGCGSGSSRCSIISSQNIQSDSGSCLCARYFNFEKPLCSRSELFIFVSTCKTKVRRAQYARTTLTKADDAKTSNRWRARAILYWCRKSAMLCFTEKRVASNVVEVISDSKLSWRRTRQWNDLLFIHLCNKAITPLANLSLIRNSFFRACLQLVGC